MENEYLDSYERAKRADRERRSHARQMKRRRQKRLKMIKGAITAAVAVVVAVCCILYTTRGEGGGQADGIDSQQMAQDAMQALAQISEPEQKFKYPSVSENYKEIVEGYAIFDKQIHIPGDYNLKSEYVLNEKDYEPQTVENTDTLHFEKLEPSEFKIFELERG